VKNINWDSSSIEEKLMGFILKMPLGGVFTIPKNKVNDLEFFIQWFEKNNYFKDEGFAIIYNPKKRLLNKNVYFEDNKEFCKKHNLYFNGKPNLIKYMQYMKWRILEYRKDYANTRIQKRVK